jgi:hypothetical protein
MVKPEDVVDSFQIHSTKNYSLFVPGIPESIPFQCNKSTVLCADHRVQCAWQTIIERQRLEVFSSLGVLRSIIWAQSIQTAWWYLGTYGDAIRRTQLQGRGIGNRSVFHVLKHKTLLTNM